MTDQSLRDALETIKAELQKRSDEGEAHLFLNIPYWQLEELLAAHPAEPVGVSDEAVERVAIWLYNRDYNGPETWASNHSDGFRAGYRADAAAVLALMGGAGTDAGE